MQRRHRHHPAPPAPPADHPSEGSTIRPAHDLVQSRARPCSARSAPAAPRALTLTSTSRAGIQRHRPAAQAPSRSSRCPVDSTAHGASCPDAAPARRWNRESRTAPEFPPATPSPRQPRAAPAPAHPPPCAPAGTTPSHPIRADQRRKTAPPTGSTDRCDSPSEVASLAATPDSRNDQYCASISTCRTRAKRLRKRPRLPEHLRPHVQPHRQPRRPGFGKPRPHRIVLGAHSDSGPSCS